MPAVLVPPSGPITPVIDGEVTSYFEWLGAGLYRVDDRSGSMHGKKFLVKEVQFGSDGTNFYLRVDFDPAAREEMSGMELRLSAQLRDGSAPSALALKFAASGVETTSVKLAADGARPECAFSQILELRVPLASFGVAKGKGMRFLFSLWQGGLPMEAVPPQGWLEMPTTNPAEMGS